MNGFDWQGNREGGTTGPDYRHPNNHNFGSIGGIARWWIPAVIAIPTVLIGGGYLLVQALGLFLSTRY